MSLGPTQRVCLVTGGAGFIGSHLIERLVARGDRVVVIDDLSTGRRSNLAAVDPSRCTVIQASVSDGLRQLKSGEFDEVYHLAAAVGVRLVIEQPIQTIETNILQTCALLEFVTASATPTLIASSSEVYGKSTRTPFSEDDDVVYGPTIYSRWSYACSKAIDEYLALAHHRQGVPNRGVNAIGGPQRGLPVVIARLFNTVGPRQVGRYGMVVPRFVASALAGQPIEVYGDGRQTRCFCDVRDVVEVLPRLLGDPACAGEVFNVGSDTPIEIRQLARVVCDTLGSPSTIVNIPYEQAFGDGFDDLRHRQPDLTKLRSAVGFAPTVPLVQTIRDLAAEMSSRPAPRPAPAPGNNVEAGR